MFQRAIVALVGALLLCGLTTPLRADAVAEAGRKVVTRWQDSVVTLEIVSKSKMSMFGQDGGEEKSEARGVIIDPSGLVVTAMSAVDPMSFLADMMGDMDTGEEGGQIDMSAEITGLTVILADGKTLQAQVVLRDKDLDLVFIRPLKAPDKPLPALTPQAAGTPQLLDQLFVLDRLGASGNRAISVTQDRVRAVVTKPRHFYVMTGSVMNMTGTGIPVFTDDGNAAGILTLRLPPKGMKQSFGMGMMADLLITTIPLADIYETAKQAPEVEKKK